ncbi:hypothetical protein BGZ63DRAFT_245025 [Mariannaea sp. PMI_226]|nr:hypothetical protein BGZ63DRAFT_245025 [Mariannaea sp. PMI_226]
MAPVHGLVHPKEYDIKDSNVELIGSDIDHQVKYKSAATEPAWNNGIVGQEPGLFIWRIEQFEVVPWPKDKYGVFYDGDSFIILNSFRVGDRYDNDTLSHDIFFWLGAHTSQDEAGTAAYKTAELDEFLQGKATQHREVQVAPSDDFLTLFPRISVRSGGVRSGFRHVLSQGEGETEQRRMLLRVFKSPAAGANGLVVVEVEPNWRSLHDSDVFILEMGDKIWMWQGKDCSPMEKGRAAQVVHDMTIAKHIDVEVVSQTEFRSKRVVDLLGGTDETPQTGFHCPRPLASSNQRPGSEDDATNQVINKRLFRLSDTTGQLKFDLVKEGHRIAREDLHSADVFVLDDGGKAIWVWEGSRASSAERKSWHQVVQSYLQYLQRQEAYENAYLMPVGKVVEGSESRTFLKAIGV